MNADGTGLVNLTDHPAYDGLPTWSPDGTRIAFRSDRSDGADIYIMNDDSTGLLNLSNHPAKDDQAAWSPKE